MTPLLEAFPLPTRYIDLRDRASKEHNGQVDFPRDWKHITGICLHQSAMDRGEDPQHYLAMGAHFGVTRGGLVMQLADVDKNVAHGNGWNAGTIGIEFVGRYSGVEGDERTYWRNPAAPHLRPQTFTDEARVSGCELIRYLCSLVASHGGTITKLVAHRQSAGSRRADPGSAIWQSVALPMSAELGLDDGGEGFALPNRKNGNGLGIPREWDPKRLAKY